MRPVKTPVLLTIFLFISALASAQLKSPFTSSFRADMETIIKDYPNHFQSIKGGEISQNPQSTDYKSTVSISGAEECIITKYSSTSKEIYSLTAKMYTTEDFEAARKKFRSIYNQLNNLHVRFTDISSCIFKGPYTIPTEEKKFTSVILSTDKGGESIKNLKIELVMEYEMLEWKIRIIVYEREREDDERGDIKG